MAMYTEVFRKQKGRAVSYPWYVGCAYEGVMEEGDIVVGVQASDRELEFIQTHFEGLRSVKGGRKTTWTGEDAQFIVNNLRDAARRNLKTPTLELED